MLTESGSLVAGVYPNLRALRSEPRAGLAQIQVLLVDADDPSCGTAALPDVRRDHPHLKILLLCESLSPAIVRCAIEEGVEGVVLKSDSVEEVIVAFMHISEGRAVMPAGWQAVSVEPSSDPLDLLSAREREVLDLAAAGMRNREIAERLMISSNTVKFHLRTIYTRLGVRNRVQAMHAMAPLQDDDLVQEIPAARAKSSDGCSKGG
jgi:DNA-binding NarL/FixJ family response regulator